MNPNKSSSKDSKDPKDSKGSKDSNYCNILLLVNIIIFLHPHHSHAQWSVTPYCMSLCY
jgi:hypothetical protein